MSDLTGTIVLFATCSRRDKFFRIVFVAVSSSCRPESFGSLVGPRISSGPILKGDIEEGRHV